MVKFGILFDCIKQETKIIPDQDNAAHKNIFLRTD